MHSKHNRDKKLPSNIESWNIETRIKSLTHFLAIFGPTVAMFSIFNLQAGNLIIGYLEATLAISALLTWRATRTLTLSVLEQLTVLQIAILTYAFLFFNAVGDIAYIYTMAFPFFISYLLGVRRGIKWIIALTAASTLTGLYLWQQGVQLYWPWEKAHYIFLAYIITTILAYFFSLQTERYVDLLKRMMVQSRKDEKALLKSESRYRALLQSSLHAIIITDSHGNILDVNRAFEEVTGYHGPEVIGKKPSMLRSDRHDITFYEHILSSIKEKGQWQGEVWSRRKSGELYPSFLSVSGIYNHKGVITNHVGIFHDISERISLEQQLRQAQKMEAVGIMVGGIAHNFNNMLAGITGNIYLARMDLQDKVDIEQTLDKAEAISFRAADMIQQLLAFASKARVSMQEVELCSMIRNHAQLLTAGVPENIVLHQDIGKEKLPVKADVTQLLQVIMNLINNATDATESIPQPAIFINLQRFDADDSFCQARPHVKHRAYAHLSIRDNGCGIDSEHLEHIFEPFFTTKEPDRGTGLGLSMLFGSVQMHQGFVEVESQINRGSTFHIYLPLLATAETRQQVKPLPPVIKEPVAGEMVLIADDEAEVLEVMSRVIKSMGYRVLEARDGVEAMQQFTNYQHQINLALLDVVMPHCGGVELARQIRELNPALPVIFLTGYDKEQVLQEGDKLAGSRVLTKPADLQLLRQTIDQALHHNPA
ncbi:MAG: PAS domain S-box protein [Mariprofundus sp.]